jgi:hypothetical protein
MDGHFRPTRVRWNASGFEVSIGGFSGLISWRFQRFFGAQFAEKFGLVAEGVFSGFAGLFEGVSGKWCFRGG